MDNQQERTHLNKYLLGWLAGFIDADGSLALAKQTYSGNRNRSHYRPMVIFHNTNMVIMKQIEDILKHYEVPYYCQDRYIDLQTSKGTKLKRSYRRITVYGFKRCKLFFEKTQIKLVGKKDRQDLMMEYINYRLSRPRGEKLTEVDIRYYEQMKMFNKLGKGELSSETTRQKGSRVIKNYKP